MAPLGSVTTKSAALLQMCIRDSVEGGAYARNFYHKPQLSLNHYWDINKAVSYTHLDVYKRQLVDSVHDRHIDTVASRVEFAHALSTVVALRHHLHLYLCRLCLLYTSRCV